MKATNLRIGNWVLIENDYEVVQNLSCNGFISSCLTPCNGVLTICEESDVHPIKLTPKWLERFGFEKHKQGYYFNGDRCVRFSFDEAGRLHCSIGDDDCGFLFNVIDCVHELQNLYFAINKEELQLS